MSPRRHGGTALAVTAILAAVLLAWPLAVGSGRRRSIELHPVAHDDTPTILAVAFAANGQTVLVAHKNDAVTVWSAADLARRRASPRHRYSWGSGVISWNDAWRAAVSARGKRALFGGRLNKLLLLELDDSTGEAPVVELADGRLYVLAISADGHRALAASQYPGDDGFSIGVWDLDRRAEGKRLVFHTSFVTDLAFSPNELRAVSSDESGKIAVWDLTTGKTVATLNEAKLQAADFAPDGRTILCFSPEDSRTVVWDPTTGSIHDVSTAGMAPWKALSLHDERRALLLGVKGRIALFDTWRERIESSVQIAEESGTPVAAAISPDGTAAVVGTDAGRIFWLKLGQ